VALPAGCHRHGRRPGSAGNLFIDANERLPDGAANPFYLRPYIGVWRPSSFETPLVRDTWRLQLAYQLDLRGEKSALRWLGQHRFSGYGEYKDVVQRRIAYRDAIVSDHAWLPPGTPRSDPSTAVSIDYFRYYVGDATGQNVDYGPAPFVPGTYEYRWGNALTNAIRSERATLGAAVAHGRHRGRRQHASDSQNAGRRRPKHFLARPFSYHVRCTNGS
jgi:hypothetical protein